jgi:hypothetical protein
MVVVDVRDHVECRADINVVQAIEKSREQKSHRPESGSHRLRDITVIVDRAKRKMWDSALTP